MLLGILNKAYNSLLNAIKFWYSQTVTEIASLTMFAAVLRLTTLIDCPAGTVADPSHYPSSRCVLPEAAEAAEATGNTEQ